MAMEFTLREISKLRIALLIWVTLSVVAAVAGPFGTLEAMGLGGRLVYWSGVVGVSIGLNTGANGLAEGRSLIVRAGIGVGFVLLLSTGFHVLNSLLFDIWDGFADWAYLTAIVGLVTAAVH